LSDCCLALFLECVCFSTAFVWDVECGSALLCRFCFSLSGFLMGEHGRPRRECREAKKKGQTKAAEHNTAALHNPNKSGAEAHALQKMANQQSAPLTLGVLFPAARRSMSADARPLTWSFPAGQRSAPQPAVA